jgi:hypothetical protein
MHILVQIYALVHAMYLLLRFFLWGLAPRHLGSIPMRDEVLESGARS